MQEHDFGKPQSLLHTQQQVPPHEDSPAIQLQQDAWGFFGAQLANVTHEHFFVSCEELLSIAAFVERHRTWVEAHVKDNEALYHNEVGGTVYVWLQSKRHSSERTVLLLTTENSVAWYGSPLHHWARPDAQLHAGRACHERQEYLRVDWEEYAERTQVLYETSA